jgi:hypothetical protein
MSSLANHMAHVDPVIVRKCKVTLLRYRASRIVANCDSRIAIEQQFVNKRLIKKPQEQRAKVSRTFPNQRFAFPRPRLANQKSNRREIATRESRLNSNLSTNAVSKSRTSIGLKSISKSRTISASTTRKSKVATPANS